MTFVRAVMQSAVITLSRDQSLTEAMAILSANDIGGAPVSDASGHIVGVLSKTDLLERARNGELSGCVEEAMMPMVFSVGPEDTLERAISIMAFEGVHRLIVLDHEARLVGILTPMDVIRELAGIHRQDSRRRITLSPAAERRSLADD